MKRVASSLAARETPSPSTFTGTVQVAAVCTAYLDPVDLAAWVMDNFGTNCYSCLSL